VPFRTGGYAAGFGTLNNQPVYIEQVYLARQTNRSLSGYVAYPFSRVQRLELAVGGRHISFDEEIQTRIFEAQTGALLVDSTDHLPSPEALAFATGTAALVYDNSYFGATGPLLGQRYRLEVSPSIGSLTMVDGLVDYRRYVMPARKLTLAARVLHAGRYGPDAEDPRLAPLFLGYPGVVRGYNIGSFSAAECPTDPNAGCPVFDRLVGSRMLVGNAEARFPLLGVLGLGGGYYGALPIEAALFVDAGLAWTRSDQPSLFDVRRQGVASAGAALRMNLFGFAVAELNYVKPFMRPDKGWYWQLNLTPGF
jgi:outer membrane protein assembly factor BamA